MDLDKGGQDCDGVNGRDERGKEKAVEELELDASEDGREREGPDCEADADGVEEGVDDGEEKDGADVVEEGPVGHEVAGLEDDRWQEEQEEGV